MRYNPAHKQGGLIGLLLICLCFLACPAAADQPVDGDASLIDRLKQIDKANDAIEDLSATFEQRRYSPLLRKPIESKGALRSVKGLTRWDTNEPSEQTMIVKSDRLELFDPEAKTLDVYPIERRFGELLANPRPAVGDWLEQFVIERAEPDALSKQMRERCKIKEGGEGVLLIRLSPREEKLAEMIERLVIVIDVETSLSRGMAWLSGEQEQTEIVFRDTKVDAGIEAKDLRLNLPDSVRVAYPLGPIPEPENKAD